MLKLHLGCASVHLEGYRNIDYRYQPGVDEVDNIGILKRHQPGSVSEIYACHCLDHFSRWDYPRVLKRWHELLMPRGVLKLSVVDFAVVCRMYHAGVPMEKLTGLLVAAQDYENNVRHMHWDEASLSQDLLESGFRWTNRWTEPFADDCSAWTIEGELFSLNMEAAK